MDKRDILLVEDNPDEAALALRMLKKARILNEVIVAKDGEEALEFLLGPKRILPAIVILDLKLPKIDGIEVLRRIRADERTALIPVIILTCSKEDQDLVKSYKNGANSYVRKPVDVDQFGEAVRQLGLYWLLLNEPPPARAV